MRARDDDQPSVSHAEGRQQDSSGRRALTASWRAARRGRSARPQAAARAATPRPRQPPLSNPSQTSHPAGVDRAKGRTWRAEGGVRRGWGGWVVVARASTRWPLLLVVEGEHVGVLPRAADYAPASPLPRPTQTSTSALIPISGLQSCPSTSCACLRRCDGGREAGLRWCWLAAAGLLPPSARFLKSPARPETAAVSTSLPASRYLCTPSLQTHTACPAWTRTRPPSRRASAPAPLLALATSSPAR